MTLRQAIGISRRHSEYYEMAHQTKCAYCDGKGWVKCPICSGRGVASVTIENSIITLPCMGCNGVGKVECPYCEKA